MLLANLAEFIKKLRALGPGEADFAARAWLLAPVIEGSLAASGLKRTLRWLESTFPVGRVQRPGLTVERATELVDAAYRRHLVSGSCMPRALVGYALLRHSGHSVRFVIGVNNERDLRAHAWIEPSDRPAETVSAGDLDFEPLMVAER